jgi:uncharacterized protein
MAKFLLEKGADPNVENKYGNTPLMWAVWNNDPNTVTLLLEKGAKPDFRNTNGETPIYLAKILRNDEIFAALMGEKAANPTAPNRVRARAANRLET